MPNHFIYVVLLQLPLTASGFIFCLIPGNESLTAMRRLAENKEPKESM